jgi:predicted enzyme related to lactoylglutathione lyase
MTLAGSKAFSGFAVKDLAAARAFYADTLGLDVSETAEMGPLITLRLGGGHDVMMYEQPTSTPASYTILNFPVPDIDVVVDELAGRGVTFERYEGMPQDDKGVMRGNGPSIAWFTDPSGNVLSVMQED